MRLQVDPWDGFPHGSRSWYPAVFGSIDIPRPRNSLNNQYIARRRNGWFKLEFNKDGVYNRNLGELTRG